MDKYDPEMLKEIEESITGFDGEEATRLVEGFLEEVYYPELQTAIRQTAELIETKNKAERLFKINRLKAEAVEHETRNIFPRMYPEETEIIPPEVFGRSMYMAGYLNAEAMTLAKQIRSLRQRIKRDSQKADAIKREHEKSVAAERDRRRRKRKEQRKKRREKKQNEET